MPIPISEKIRDLLTDSIDLEPFKAPITLTTGNTFPIEKLIQWVVTTNHTGEPLTGDAIPVWDLANLREPARCLAIKNPFVERLVALFHDPKRLDPKMSAVSIGEFCRALLEQNLSPELEQNLPPDMLSLLGGIIFPDGLAAFEPGLLISGADIPDQTTRLYLVDMRQFKEVSKEKLAEHGLRRYCNKVIVLKQVAEQFLNDVRAELDKFNRDEPTKLDIEDIIDLQTFNLLNISTEQYNSILLKLLAKATGDPSSNIVKVFRDTITAHKIGLLSKDQLQDNLQKFLANATNYPSFNLKDILAEIIKNYAVEMLDGEQCRSILSQLLSTADIGSVPNLDVNSILKDIGDAYKLNLLHRDQYQKILFEFLARNTDNIKVIGELNDDTTSPTSLRSITQILQNSGLSQPFRLFIFTNTIMFALEKFEHAASYAELQSSFAIALQALYPNAGNQLQISLQFFIDYLTDKMPPEQLNVFLPDIFAHNVKVALPQFYQALTSKFLMMPSLEGQTPAAACLQNSPALLLDLIEQASFEPQNFQWSNMNKIVEQFQNLAQGLWAEQYTIALEKLIKLHSEAMQHNQQAQSSILKLDLSRCLAYFMSNNTPDSIGDIHNFINRYPNLANFILSSNNSYYREIQHRISHIIIEANKDRPNVPQLEDPNISAEIKYDIFLNLVKEKAKSKDPTNLQHFFNKYVAILWPSEGGKDSIQLFTEYLAYKASPDQCNDVMDAIYRIYSFHTAIYLSPLSRTLAKNASVINLETAGGKIMLQYYLGNVDPSNLLDIISQASFKPQNFQWPNIFEIIETFLQKYEDTPREALEKIAEFYNKIPRHEKQLMQANQLPPVDQLLLAFGSRFFDKMFEHGYSNYDLNQVPNLIKCLSTFFKIPPEKKYEIMYAIMRRENPVIHLDAYLAENEADVAFKDAVPPPSQVLYNEQIIPSPIVLCHTLFENGEIDAATRNALLEIIKDRTHWGRHPIPLPQSNLKILGICDEKTFVDLMRDNRQWSSIETVLTLNSLLEPKSRVSLPKPADYFSPEELLDRILHAIRQNTPNAATFLMGGLRAAKNLPKGLMIDPQNFETLLETLLHAQLGDEKKALVFIELLNIVIKSATFGIKAPEAQPAKKHLLELIKITNQSSPSLREELTNIIAKNKKFFAAEGSGGLFAKIDPDITNALEKSQVSGAPSPTAVEKSQRR